MNANVTLQGRVIAALDHAHGDTAAPPVAIDGLSVQITAIFDDARAAGHAAAGLTELDRQMRFAARSVETGVAAQVLRERGSRPIPIVDGLALASVDAGSGEAAL